MNRDEALRALVRGRATDVAQRDDAAPHGRLLGGSRYGTLVTGAGSGASRWQGWLLTAWSADPTEDGDGFFVYLRDRDDGRFWSAGAQPVPGRPERYAASSLPGRVTLERVEHGIESRLDVCVARAHDVEVRRVTLRNASAARRAIEVTTYAEVVLHDAAAHHAHPAFQKLFVQTEHEPRHGVLLARRRPRSASERPPWLMHALVGDGPCEWETDRARFVGRGRTLAAPQALAEPGPLSGTTGSVLDPVVSMRRVVVLEPGGEATVFAVLAAAATRDELLEVARRVLTADALHAALANAAAAEEETAASLGVAPGTGEALQDLAAGMLYRDPALRASPAELRRARGGTARLAELGLRRDATFAVARVDHAGAVAHLDALAHAARYWRAKGVAVSVVALCAGAEAAAAARTVDGVSVVVEDEVTPADVAAVLAAASLVVPRPARGRRRTRAASPPAYAARAGTRGAETAPPAAEPPREDLRLWNGLGGFAHDGSAYVVRLAPGVRPPMPWTNVIANERFGFLVSESGAGNTWSRNSRENRLTPWPNDVVRDPHAEALYVRDEDARLFWSPTPGPVPSGATCVVRHELGATTWQQTAHELAHEVTTFVPRSEPVRVQRVRLENLAPRARRISVFAYQRLVLGGLAHEAGRFVTTSVDDETGALLARNRMNDEFADGVVFAAAAAARGAPGTTHRTTDRTAFLGRDGSPENPAALRGGATLDGTTGVGLDPCAAQQVVLELEPGASAECVFLLGEATSEDAARALVRRFLAADAVEHALREVRGFWGGLAGTLQVATPSAALDVLLNGWLLYQALSCRIWGRTAFYQSGGALGFRDQLQDSGAFLLVRPELTREQILLHAAHQFPEGDVLHWWHPPTARGIRTRFSDDLCWLAWLTAQYVRATGDTAILDERAGFVTARALAPGEDEAYLLPGRSAETADLFEHCCRALDRALTRGAHGLPLMGTGDWNDGMNRVGREGRGESVWMAFFLFRILEDFLPLVERRGDTARAARYRAYQASLPAALEEHAWDGDWYRRAYYDDGSPLGTAADAECRIDALAQAWAVLSEAVPRARAARAVDAVERELVDDGEGLIRLLAPPFDRDPRDPGYIKGYVPGIRENGGQYTHAALWVAQAVARLGRNDRAAALLEMLTPVHHARDADAVATYQVEPYVVAADVYGVPPHVGRGGWTWYTGSAAWMYRVAVESLLGLEIVGGTTLVVRPCVPDAWPGFTARLILPDGATTYEVEVVNDGGRAARVVAAQAEGAAVEVASGEARVALVRDGGTHRVRVALGA